MELKEWEETVPRTIRDDSLWKMKAYRLALYLSDLCWEDTTHLYQDYRTMSLSNQLYRSVGSIGANLAEGYSRGTSRERAHFYEYSLGSARESRDWYYKAHNTLGETIITQRFDVLTEIIRLLLVMIPDQRKHQIRDTDGIYSVDQVSDYKD